MGDRPLLRINIDEDTDLRIYEERHAREVAALVDRNRAYLRQWLPRVDSSRTVEDSKAFIQHSLQQLAEDWVKTQLHRLRHEGPRRVLRTLRVLRKQHPGLKVVVENVAYLEKRQAHLQSPRYQADEWPIGSGMVESANKQVMQTRLKGPWMHWACKNVNPMLELRTTVCNDRWEEAWQEVCARGDSLPGREQSERHSGQGSHDAVKLLQQLQQQGVLHLLAPAQGFYLVDLPPTLTSGYGSPAASLPEALVLVVRAQAIPERMVAETCTQLKDLPIHGLILNQDQSHIPRWLRQLL